MNEIASCPSCGYPASVKSAGQILSCANCSSKMETVISQGVTLPSPLVIAVVSFAIGAFFGPHIAAGTKRGREWLLEKAKGG